MKAMHAVMSGVAILGLCGCASMDPTHSFGGAARRVAAAQTVNPAAAAAARPVVEGSDPELVKSSVDALRHEGAAKDNRAPRL